MKHPDPMSDKPARFIPYGRQALDEDDIAAVVDVLRSGWLTTGPAVAQFESALAETCMAPEAIAVCNGTAALHLAMTALGLGSGDCAVVPSVTFLATANAVHLCGGRVVFADVDPNTGLMTAETCREAIRRSPSPVRAIVPVHLGGRFVDMRAIGGVARDVGAVVVEDACHALGGALRYDGETASPAGACVYSDAATFSFHPVKTISTGEGGAVTCRTHALVERMRKLRNHDMERKPENWTQATMGFTAGEPNSWYYEMAQVGFNYRLSDVNCALGISQLRKLPRFIEVRRALATEYDQRLAHLGNLVKPVATPRYCLDGRHLYQVLIDFAAAGATRQAVVDSLRRQNIGTQVQYIPVHRQPVYKRMCPDLDLPGANSFYESTLSLPLHVGMTSDDVGRVVAALGVALLQPQPETDRATTGATA